MFVDHIRIYARAGDGGNGVAHFRREKYVPLGGPDGGDGGKGGSITLRVDHDTDSLKDFFYKSEIKAKPGAPGAGRRKKGKSGSDILLRVPPGTLIYREEEGSDPPQRESEPIADLVELGTEFILCSGGNGGKGNWHYKSATNQSPADCTEGTKGEQGYFHLELRGIADAGLVGFPNAGKSTLLRALSAARPKVANYPFTTLKPSVGVVDFDGYMRATVADIPGLIEGAHQNVGLGHDFLRHIMRCRLLLFVIDMAGSEARDPISDLEILRKEIKMHDEKLAKNPWLVVANKMDLAESSELLNNFRLRFPKIEIIPISAEQGEGIAELKERLKELIGHASD